MNNRYSQFDEYGFRYLPYHMVQSGRREALRKMLLEFEWLQAKLQVTNVVTLLEDYNLISADQALENVKNSIRIASHILKVDNDQLGSQLVGRLLNLDSIEIQNLLNQVRSFHGNHWLCPITASLLPPTQLMLQTLSNPEGVILAMTVMQNGRHLLLGIGHPPPQRDALGEVNEAEAINEYQVKVRDLHTGEEEFLLGWHTDDINAVTMSPSGRFAASGSGRRLPSKLHLEFAETAKLMAIRPSRDNSLKLWDLEKRAKKYVLEGHQGAINALVFTPDSQYVLSASDDRTVKVWSVDEGIETFTFRGHTQPVKVLCVHDLHIRRTSAISQKKEPAQNEKGILRRLFGKKNTDDKSPVIESNKIQPARLVFSASDTELKIWILITGEEIGTMKLDPFWDKILAFIPDGRIVFEKSSINGNYFTVNTLDINTGEHQILGAHSRTINAVAYVPERNYLISASSDQKLKVFDLRRSQEMFTLEGHSAKVRTITTTPDGKTAISAADDKTIKFWDLETGNEIDKRTEIVDFATLFGHSGAINAVETTPSGDCAISASQDKTLKFWDLKTHQELSSFDGHSEKVNALAITPNGRLAISASNDHTLKVYDLNIKKAIHTLRGHSSIVNSVVVTSDSGRAISASDDCTLKMWDLRTGRELRTYKGHSKAVTGVAVKRDDKTIVSISSDQTMRIWNAEDGTSSALSVTGLSWDKVLAVTLTGNRIIFSIQTPVPNQFDIKLWDFEFFQPLDWHTPPINAAAITPNGKFAIIAFSDRTLKIWDLDRQVSIKSMKDCPFEVLSADITSDADLAVLGTSNNQLKIWHLEERRPIGEHEDDVNGISIAPNQNWAISASHDRTLKLWDLTTGKELLTLKGHAKSVNAAVWHPFGRQIISASNDHTLRLWDLETKLTLGVFQGHTDVVRSAAITPDGSRMISASSDNTLKIWDMKTKTVLLTLRGHSHQVLGVVVTSDGSRAISASADKTLKIWDIHTGLEIQTLRGHTDAIWALATAQDNSLMVSASADRTLKVWDLYSGVEQRTLSGHSDTIYSVALTPNGLHAVSASNDHSLRVWDLHTGKTVAAFSADSPIYCCAISSDGKTIIAGTGSQPGRIHFLRFN